MKLRTLLVLTLISAGILSMTSCVKNYTCTCTIKYSGYPGLPDSTIKEFEIKDTQAGAKDACKKESYSHDENGIHTDESCVLK